MAFEDKGTPAHDTPKNDALSDDIADNSTADSGKTDADNLRAVLAKNIMKYRKAAELSRADVAQKLSITEVAVGMYERGERQPSIEMLCKLSDILNTPVDALLGRGSSYDVVKAYRLTKAKDFFIDAGFMVSKAPDRNWIFVGHESRRSYRLFNGSFQTEIPPEETIRFSGEADFLKFAELLMETFLKDELVKNALDDVCIGTANSDKIIVPALNDIAVPRNIYGDPLID